MSVRRSRHRRDAELDEEIRTHLDMAQRDRVARGESPEDAPRAVRREFGNITVVKDVTREMWAGNRLEQFARDARQAARGLLRVPGFAAVAVLTLTLGIGANTAILCVVHGVLLTPLAYPHPEQLIFITSQFTKLGFDQFPIDAAEYLELRERSRSLQDVGAYAAAAVNVGTTGDPARVPAAAAPLLHLSTKHVGLTLREAGSRTTSAAGRSRAGHGLVVAETALAVVLVVGAGLLVLAYAVAERRREIGIRMALGASERGVLRMVLGQGLALTVTGLVLGLAGALLATRVTRSLRFGVEPWDPLTFAAVLVVMLVVALAACIIPARRATSVDPLVALRID